MVWVSNSEILFAYYGIEQMSKYTGENGSQFLLVEKRVTNMEKGKTTMKLILNWNWR